MKKNNFIKAVFLVFTFALFFTACQNSNDDEMRHIVIFTYKSSATNDQIGKVTKALSELKNKIPGIVDFEHGMNNSPEGLNKGFTHVYLFTFEDAAARDAYLPHPEHEKFGEMLGEMDIVEDVFVVDYSPKN